MTHRLTLATACLLDAHARLLVVRKRGTRHFMLPGGKLEPGESPHAALRRELEEELGLQADRLTFHALGEFHAPAANEPDTELQAQVYVARFDGEVAVAAELEEAHWWDSSLALPLAPLVERTLLPVLEARGWIATP